MIAARHSVDRSTLRLCATHGLQRKYAVVKARTMPTAPKPSGATASSSDASTSGSPGPGTTPTPAGEASTSHTSQSVAAAAETSDARPQGEGASEEQEGGKCPICVMFEQGGCKEAFDAFMDCGVAAEKGGKDYQDCVVLFDAMRECMQRNPAVFAPLLQDVNNAVPQSAAGADKGEEQSKAP